MGTLFLTIRTVMFRIIIILIMAVLPHIKEGGRHISGIINHEKLEPEGKIVVKDVKRAGKAGWNRLGPGLDKLFISFFEWWITINGEHLKLIGQFKIHKYVGRKGGHS
ncbi:DUF805 domain-containing protein [Babesia caballi]|uniref:DUF805 domain-containing protein n=1 Tax=Babesia caballi TaxID=5871 RepID=A0AAV4LXG2_BABCB|nr:DUF805 domain-containing protein [Babesia caballi]